MKNELEKRGIAGKLKKTARCGNERRQMKPIKTSFPVISSLGMCSLLLTGCASPIADYTPTTPSAGEQTVQNQGVEVTVDPFVEAERTSKYFNMDAVGKGIGIIHVHVANKSADQTLLVEKKDFQLLADGSESAVGGSGSDYKRSNAGADTVGTVGAVAGGLGGMALLLVSSSMLQHTTEIERNFVSKELGDQTLPPGESMDGFVYFSPLKKGQDWTHSSSILVKIPATKTHQVIEFKIPLHH